MASGVYNRLKYNVMKKLVDLSGDTFKVMLLNNSHSFNADHNVNTDINTNELAASGNYTTGGATLSTPTVTQDDTNDCATFDAVDTSWTTATFTAYHAVIYDTTVSNNLVCSIDFGGAKSVSAGTFTIQWSANGIIRLS
jgi:hypothetical protein